MASYDFAATRLFLDTPLSAGAQAAVEGDRANYLLNVLRLRDGDAILIFNGRDGEWRAHLAQTRRKATTLLIETRTREQTSGPDLDYCFAPLKHARLDYTVQKAVEMGSSRLRPVLTRRTQVSRVNLDRMRANAIEAAEQCGVLTVPFIDREAPLERMVAEWEPDRLLVFCDEDAPLGDPAAALRAAPPRRKLAILVGPEGGFDAAERAALVAHPASLRLSLGPRILRADTAAVAALALIQTLLGDWRGGDAGDTISPR